MDQDLLTRVFDKQAFQDNLTSGKPAIPTFKNAIKHAQEVMHDEFRKTLDANILVYTRSWFMDHINLDLTRHFHLIIC